MRKIRCRCPFTRLYKGGFIQSYCPYIDFSWECSDIEINPSNSDAFCAKAVEKILTGAQHDKVQNCRISVEKYPPDRKTWVEDKLGI